VLFLVDGAQPSNWANARLKDYARIVLLFDGRDANALSSARAAWKSAKDAGHDVTYWKESASGKWEKQG
jgi:DNA polymerase-3 subunit chi